ncbi:MAG: fibronectin type III domain-containing protein [Ruminiclostridium sp.]|nr:fibronectin type III domain-containing protein [Ruminiclostridium sp.]
MKKLLSRITAATLAAGMLVTEASASLVVPESTDPGTIAGSGMWLVQLYNEGDPDGDKPATDYGIDYSTVAGARFTIELDLDNPDLEENAFSLFEGNIGGGIVLSCCGGDIIQYEDDDETVTEIYSTYNWPSHNWWGIEFVNAEGETVDTNPNTMDDDLTNDNELSTVKTGDYTYTITADFVNPLSCETDEWEINEIAVMQLAFQEWGNDTIPVEITCCEILDADGEVLVWFDGQGNPSLRNIAEQPSTDGPSTDEPSGDREVISLSGTATTITSEWGPDCTLTQINTPTVDGTYVLAPTDKIEIEVVSTDESTDTSAWVLAVTGFDSEWNGWTGVNGESGELSFSTTVQAVMDALSVEDIDQLGGLLLQVWNATIGDEVNWRATITPDDGSADPETPSVPEDPEEPEEPEDPEDPVGNYNGYIFLQTEAYSFRNKWYEETYGRDTEYFDDIVVWSEDPEAFPDYSDYYDAELKGYVMPANFMDTDISGDGFYRVGVTDFDWAMDGSDLFNMLGVATDIPYSEDVIITDISLRIDGEEVETYENGYVDLEDQENGYLVVTLANIWDTTLDGYDGVYPTESVEISFNVSGLGSSGVDPDAPSDPDEPEDPDGPEASVNNGYMFIQTGAYSFRNKWYDESFGKDSVYFGNVLVNGENAETYPDYAEYYNFDISAYVMPASFTDAVISGDGSYQVSITGFDWAMDGADSFNLLGISTDIPYSDDITISDITILVDDMIVETDAEACVSDDEGYICITLVDIWNDVEAEGFNGTYPTSSIGIDFSINGLDVPSDEPSVPDEPSDPEEPDVPDEPEHDGWLKFYMQNRGGDWAWFDAEEYTIHIDEVDGTALFELSWLDIQSAITNESGESLLYAPVEEGESYPALGIEIGSEHIPEVGDKGRVKATITDITITLTDGTSFKLPNRLLKGDLLGAEEDWGFSGYNVLLDLADVIMATLGIDGEEYFELLKTVDNVSATVILEEFIPYAENLPGTTIVADAVEITDVKVEKDSVTLSWTEVENADGYNVYVKTDDGYELVETITENSDTFSAEPCTQYTFAVCGYIDADDQQAEGSRSEVTVKTHHNFEDCYTIDKQPTCSEVGVESLHCLNCDARTGAIEIPTTDHEYSSVEVAPTYEREGYTLHMCAYCNDSYKTDVTEMLALPAMTGVAVASRDASSITFRWDEYLGLDIDGTMLGYVIEEMEDGEVRAGEDIDDITITQWKYTGLRSSTEYTIQIRAYGVDSAGKRIYTKGVILENVATLPASMTGFAVTGRGSDNLTLSWNKNATADGYVVQIQENNSWKNIAVIKSADTTSHVVTGLEPNSFYRFRMVAYKSYGTSKLYSKYTGAIPGYTAPAMVTGLTVSASTDTTMTVTWDDNAYADGFILDIYKDGKWQQAADVTSAETSVVIEGLTASTLYKFRIKSYASNGSLLINSTYSASVSGTTKPAAMSDVKVSASTSTSLTVSWNKNASATGYILQMYTDGVWKNVVNIKDINTTSYVISGLSASTSYKVRMVAYNNSTGSTLYGKYTGAITGTTSPAAVTNLRMTNRGTDFISVAWDKNENATGYMVYIYDGTSWKLVKTLTSASSVSHKITGLESGKTYKVNVKAYKTSGTQKLIADASMITATTL